MLEKYFSIGQYNYCAGNPVNNIDPTGMMFSTHTDENGIVVAVFDDGDLGVYKHLGNEQVAKAEVDRMYSQTNTSAGGQHMGESLHSLSFADQQTYNQTGQVGTVQQFKPNKDPLKIDFGSTELTNKVQSIVDAEPSMREYMSNAKRGGEWDIKAHVQNGSLLYGKYASPRDAGNFAAGIFAGTQGQLSPVVHFGYGAYNIAGSMVGTAAITGVVASLSINKATRPMGIAAATYIRNWGEDRLSRRSINLGERFHNNGYKY